MLAGAPGTAAAAAAASVLALEGGTQALAWGVPFYAACVVMSLLVDAVRARLVFRGKLPTVPWRPNLMFNVYQKPKRNLLDRVSRRMAMDNGSDVDAKTKNHSHRAFATVVGNCPFAHVGGADLARVALNQQPVKSPLYRAFESFAGVGIFTAEGEDWAAKRSEVLGAFASAGLEPLAAASKRSASKLTAEIDAQLAAEKDVEKGATGRADGDGVEVDMLPRLQRATLRATFEYLAGVDLETAASVDRRSVSEWEDEYLTAATDLRHLIPARARSVWMLSDWAYAASPVGRIERRRIKEARRLPELALRTARPGSPLDDLRRGSAHAAEWGTRHAWWSRLRRTAGVGRDALLDEATTLLFAGHDTQSATLSWALLRLASDVKTQGTLRASLTRDPHVVTGLGLEDVVCVDATGVSRVGDENGGNGGKRPAWRTSEQVPVLEAVLRETLRLHPVAPFVARKLVRDAELGGGDEFPGGLTLPEGCAAGVWLHAVHRDPSAWEKPDAFVPNRWLVSNREWATERTRRTSFSAGGADVEGRGAEGVPTSGEAETGSREAGDGGLKVRFKGPAFMPFATGPRACVGQHLAWVYMRCVLARLVCAYEVRLGGDVDDALTPSVGFTVTPANAARVRLVPIGNS